MHLVVCLLLLEYKLLISFLLLCAQHPRIASGNMLNEQINICSKPVCDDCIDLLSKVSVVPQCSKDVTELTLMEPEVGCPGSAHSGSSSLQKATPGGGEGALGTLKKTLNKHWIR